MKKDLFDFSDFDDDIVENIAQKCPDMNKSEQKALCGKIRQRLNTAENFIAADAVSGVEPAKKPVFRYVFETAAAAVLALAIIPVAFKALKMPPMLQKMYMSRRLLLIITLLQQKMRGTQQRLLLRKTVNLMIHLKLQLTIQP